MLSVITILVLSYLVGSIPASVWVGKAMYRTDLRDHGSGNAGATNAFRVLGWKAGLVSTIVDLGKGMLAAGLISQIRIDPLPNGFGFWEAESVIMLIAGVTAVFGHMYPVLAGFRGGKGVNTTAGVLLAITPMTMLVTLGVFVLVLFASRYVSLASLAATATYPTAIAFRKYVMDVDALDASIFVFSLLLAVSIFLAHRTNIQRLLNGSESRIRSFKMARGMKGRGEV
ncbi:MAG: glycerol-3-phosphate 1-O-acyltransferase PlsY [Bacteroidetes Order II. Incertae sedis bacterium]|jgi:glycerol-3-phosphate acyltransferase PlsY|nr:glycerol-3-phosphate 1-O-acyltransferase PlsY [Bacteroidetes Order II. bacterium]MBT4601618.1 glycerol-3-phosphate 1-O-acyltransferase PlsY [Bacteroidetes Order II. bacterium]MBT5250971.1 glycerol-3-phosphate 1-O-acyltransferase PlsY [Bacteroidetes Order II. bacterium]MBT6201334.1 glycerol-3-phosphate 1-O-acyltransferase PlsY [Bacteroidetes Order II. bacterium]MBT6425338.1 glycerol-3-phosphate 1-O-acyltransferase PlsY [Bacteroidetes Order II. bacterium]